MSSVGLYTISDGKTYKGEFATDSKEPFFMFRMKPAVDGSIGYDNSKVASLNGVVTQLDIVKSETIAVTPTIGSSIYLYVGGESAWAITISGLLFADCEGKYEHGFKSAIDWYVNNNVSKTGKCCELTLGNGNVFKAYLTAFRGQAVAKACNLFTFAFKFYAVKDMSNK